jgi:hypothetical protein
MRALLSAFTGNCIRAISDSNFCSGIEMGWHLVNHFKATEGSPLSPKVEFSADKISQSVIRGLFAFYLPQICWVGFCSNGAMGGIHFIYCICNIKTIDRKELEKAFVRLAIAAYDLAIYFLLASPVFGYLGIPIKVIIIVAFAFYPQLTLQLHRIFFGPLEKEIPDPAAKAEENKKIKTIEFSQLDPACVIQSFAKGINDTWLPPPAPVPLTNWQSLKSRCYAFPSSMTYCFSTIGGRYRTIN